MMMHYKSDYPNQVQQINVSISQHYYLLKDGTIKWQQKKLDVNWNNYYKTGKIHLVTYIIRDHFSSCFYAEIHPMEQMPEISEFLYNAWKQKKEYQFHGIGNTVMVPQITLDRFPKIKNFFNNVERVHLQLPTSGFNSGLSSIRLWEQKIKFILNLRSGLHNIYSFQKNISYVNNIINGRFDSEDSNLKKWLNNNPKILLPGEKSFFFSLFEEREK